MRTKDSESSVEKSVLNANLQSKPNESVARSGSDSESLHPRRPITSTPGQWQTVFRLQDQITLIFCSLIALFSIGGYLYWNERVTNQVIELDRMPYVETQLKIDINSATISELSLIPGIGEEKAREIIRTRSKMGGMFADETDLLKVEGIGPKTLDVIRPYLAPMPNSDARAER